MKGKFVLGKKKETKDDKKTPGKKPFWLEKAEKKAEGKKKPEDKKKKKKPVSEVLVLSFSEFLNEDATFQDQFSNPKSEEDDTYDTTSSDPTLSDGTEGQEDNSPEDDSGDDGNFDSNTTDADNWGKPEPDSSSDIDDGPKPGEISKRPSKLEKLNTSLSAINTKIATYLTKYKAGELSIEQYKDTASPLLAQRKQLQSQLDSYFNVSMTGDEDSPIGLETASDQHGF